MKFGDIYFLPKLRAISGIGGHFVVILFADPKAKVVYYQTLESGIFKVFPNFGILNNNRCATCMHHKKAKAFRKYLSNKSMYLDIDDVIFLNFNKYVFLNKETLICLQRIEKGNYYMFKQMVTNNIYKYKGSLLKVNKKQALVTILYTSQISPQDKKLIIYTV